jgi:hypothetical protein
MACPWALALSAILVSSSARAARARLPPVLAMIAAARSIAHCAKSARFSIVAVYIVLFASDLFRCGRKYREFDHRAIPHWLQ